MKTREIQKSEREIGRDDLVPVQSDICLLDRLSAISTHLDADNVSHSLSSLSALWIYFSPNRAMHK